MFPLNQITVGLTVRREGNILQVDCNSLYRILKLQCAYKVYVEDYISNII